MRFLPPSRAGLRRARLPFRPVHAPLAATALALALGACSRPEPPAAAAPRPVRVMPVVLAVADTADSFTGAVRARIESEFGFRVGGKVVRRRVDVGQPVRAGAVLAEVDAADYALALDAALHQQQAAAVDAEQAAADAARFARLRDEGALSAGDAERQQARADAARARLDQARRQADHARNRATYAVLRAPFDGVVTAWHAEVGQVVAEGQRIVAMAADGDREIVVDLPERLVLQARRTPLAQATLPATDAPAFAVRLRELAPAAAAATRTYRARYRIAADAPPLALGMTATVTLGGVGGAAAPAAPVATIPSSALHHRDGAPAVWTVSPGGGPPALVPVSIVRYTQDHVQVTGLSDGQLVVTAGVQLLTADQPVVAALATGAAALR